MSFHILVAWMLYIVALGIPSSFVYLLVTRYSTLPESVVILIGSILIVGFIVAVVGVILFSVLWLLYLRFVVGSKKASYVESQLKKYMHIGHIEPIYSKIKKYICGYSSNHA